MKRLGFYIPVLIFLSILGYMAVGLTLDPQKLPSTLIDKPVPEFDLPPIEGFDKGFSSKDLLGQVTIINIWGSWCVSCVYEHPVLMEIARKKLVPIYGLDWKDQPGDGARWLQEKGNPYTLIGDDADGRIAIEFGVTGAPETFVVDKGGRIRYKFIGPITVEDWENTLYPLVKELRSQ